MSSVTEVVRKATCSHARKISLESAICCPTPSHREERRIQRGEEEVSLIDNDDENEEWGGEGLLLQAFRSKVLDGEWQ